MSLKTANALWAKKKSLVQKPVATTTTGRARLQHVEYPSEDEWKRVVAAKQTRVFACWVAQGKGRIAFSWTEAAKGITKNLSVEVFTAEDTLFFNFARAEEFLASASAELSIAEQIEAARKVVASSSSSTRKKAGAASAASRSASFTGQSKGNRVGMSGVVHTREVTQIRRCFIDAKEAVVILGSPAAPEEDESVPVDEAPPAKPSVKGAEGKALSRFEGVFPVVVSAIPQIVSVHVVGSSEEDVWRVVRSALTDKTKTCLGREEFVRDVWPALWGAFGERWRSKL